MSEYANGWVPSTVVPFMFGPGVSCGDDEITGPVYQPMYGTGQKNNLLFTLISRQSSIQVAIAAKQIGSPTAPLVLVLYDSVGNQLASANLSPSQVLTSEGFTAFVTFTPASPMTPGQYLLTATAPAATSTDCYQIYFNLAGREWAYPLDRAGYTGPPGYGNSGYATIWVKDAAGNDLLVHPIGYTYDTGFDTVFTALSNFQTNALLLWISDQSFVVPQITATFSLADTTIGSTLGTSTASIYKMAHGLQGLEIFPFDNGVIANITAGHNYRLIVSDGGNIYGPYPRGSSITPAVAGTSVYNLGGLALLDPVYKILDYGGVTITTQNNQGGLGGTDGIVVRIVPKFTSVITSFVLKTNTQLNGGTETGNYNGGYPVTLSQYASNENLGAPLYASPTGNPLVTATPIDSGSIPLNGWMAIDNLNIPVTAGVPCWLQLNAPTAPNSLICLQRCVNSWRNLAETVTNGVYSFFGQGPTDLAFAAVTSKEIIGSPYDISISHSVGTQSLVAQPFMLTNARTLSSIFALTSGNIQVALYPDSVSGTGPNMSSPPLATGSFQSIYQYIYSGAIIPYATPVSANGNTKYWVVYLSSDGSGAVTIALYRTRPNDPYVPVGYDALISNDSGSTWNLPTSFQGTTIVSASTLFIIGAQPTGTVQASPTTTTVTVSSS